MSRLTIRAARDAMHSLIALVLGVGVFCVASDREDPTIH